MNLVVPTSARRVWPVLVAATLLALATARPAEAMPRKVGLFELGTPHDSLLAIAAAGNYRLERDLKRQVNFAPPVEGDAEVIATLRAGRVVRLQFVWPGTPQREDFEAVIGEYIAQLGQPLDSTEAGGVPQVRWMDDSTLATVRASIGSKRVPLQGNLFDRATFESGGEAAGAASGDTDKPKAVKPSRSPKKSPSRTTHGGVK
jgi:hypothetical protein